MHEFKQDIHVFRSWHWKRQRCNDYNSDIRPKPIRQRPTCTHRDRIATKPNNDPIIPPTYQTRKPAKQTNTPPEPRTTTLKPKQDLSYHIKITDIDTQILDEHLEPFLWHHKDKAHIKRSNAAKNNTKTRTRSLYTSKDTTHINYTNYYTLQKDKDS